MELKRPWHVLFRLWNGAYKISLAAKTLLLGYHIYQPTYNCFIDLTFKSPATRLKFILTDLSPFQHKWPLVVCLDVLGKEIKVLIFMIVIVNF